jgi:hypothetical protein
MNSPKVTFLDILNAAFLQILIWGWEIRMVTKSDLIGGTRTRGKGSKEEPDASTAVCLSFSILSLKVGFYCLMLLLRHLRSLNADLT